MGAAPTCASIPRRPLIAGGSGLIGSNLLTLLAHTGRCELIRVLDMRPPMSQVLAGLAVKVEFVCFCLGVDSREKLLETFDGVDCVFSVVTPHVQLATTEQFEMTNHIGVQTMAQACVECGVPRLVHLSSTAATGQYFESVDMAESQALPPLESYESPYDITKRLGEEAVLRAARGSSLSACCIRSCGIWLSPWDFCWGNMWPVVPGLIAQPRGERMDFIDGRDVCRALVLAGQALELRPQEVSGEVFSVTRGEAFTPDEVGAYAARLLGYPFIRLPSLVVRAVQLVSCSQYHIRSRLGLRVPGIKPHRFIAMLFFRQTFDNGKALRLLGFAPKVDMKSSMARIVAQWLKHTGATTGLRPLRSFLASVSLVSLAIARLLLLAIRRR